MAREDIKNKNRETRDKRHTETRDRKTDKRLYFLDDLDDYKVASGQPDVRGWSLVDANREEIGKVENLLVDIVDEKVRYLDVELDERIIGEDFDPQANTDIKGVHSFTNRDGDTHLIVPIGLARLNKDDNIVVVDEVDKQKFQRAPRYRKGSEISADYEYAVSSALVDPEAEMPEDRPSGTLSDEFYNRDAYNEERFYSERMKEQNEQDRSEWESDEYSDRKRNEWE